jgi:hypothetical protein
VIVIKQLEMKLEQELILSKLQFLEVMLVILKRVVRLKFVVITLTSLRDLAISTSSFASQKDL